MAKEKTMNRGAVVAGSLVIALFAGLLYTWSLFVRPICEQYGWGTDQVAMMGNVMLAAFCGGAAIGGNLLPKWGARKSCICGSLMFGLGILISAFIASPVVMYITWGACGGFGAGVLYTVGMYVASAWFPDKRGLVMGIFLAIFGLSVTILSSPLNAMLTGMGVQRTVLILGVFLTVLLTLVSAMVMQMPPAGWHPEGYQAAAGKKNVDDMQSLSVGEALKTKEFWLFAAAFILMIMPYAFISSYTAVYATDVKNFTPEQAVTIVSMMGIGTAAGRFLGGAFVDKLGYKLTYAIFCMCSVVSCVLMLVSNSFAAIVFAFILLAAGYGGRTPVYGVLPVIQFGPENASALFGYGCFGTIASSIIAPLITVATRNATGSYTASIMIALVISVAGMLCILLCANDTPVMKKNKMHD